MPFAEFQSGNAGLALPNFALQSQDAYASLMDRAQRRRIAEEEIGMKKQEFANNLATSALQQDSIRAEIGIRRAQLSETERKARDLAGLRDEYNAVAGSINSSLNEIQRMRDPSQQRQLLNKLKADSSRFYRDPELKTVLETQFSAIHDTVANNESVNLAQALHERRADPNEEAIKLKFPGRQIRYTVDPAGGVPMFVATEKPDPVLEQQAVAAISLAESEDDLAELKKNQAVQIMMSVPGSKVPELYRTFRSSLVKERQADDTIGARRDAANKRERIPASLFESTEKMKNSFNSLQDIKKSYDNDKGIKDPFIGLVRELNPYDTDARTLAAKVTAAVPMLARGIFGEVGVLTDKDMATYKSLLPNVRSPEEAAKKLFEFLSNKLETVYNERIDSLEQQGYNVKGFRKVGGKKTAAVNGSRAQALARGGP